MATEDVKTIVVDGEISSAVGDGLGALFNHLVTAVTPMSHSANFEPATVIITTSLETLDDFKSNFSQPTGTLLVAKYRVTFTLAAILSDFQQHGNLYPGLVIKQPDIGSSTVSGRSPRGGF